jgi:perosamine synthetase
MTDRIVYTKPSITDVEVAYATDAARNGWGAKCYDYIHRFEAAFAEYVGTKYAISTSSCTGAMELGLAAIGIGPGDEVILADTNWIAAVAPVMHLGATPVFVDILSDSWCLDPERTSAAITSKTKAIIATHLYGNLCEMNKLKVIAEQHDLTLIEDSAEAIGARYNEAHAGSMGRFGTFSFHGTKTMTTGEGGMFVTNDGVLADRVMTLSNHGRDRAQKKQFWADAIGYKFKMSNVQAAIGLGQIERIKELTDRKFEILQRYKSRLLVHQGLSMNPEPAHTRNGAWMPTLVFSSDLSICRERAILAFEDANIDARVFFYPLSSQPMFQSVSTPHAHDICERAINLPSYHDMTDDDIDRVCNVVETLLRR